MSAGVFLVLVCSLFSLFTAQLLACAPEPIDPNNQEVINAATFAVNNYNEQSKTDYEYKLVKVVSATNQIVAGVIYEINAEIGKTDCKKGTTSDVQSCNLIKDSQLAETLYCSFSVLIVPWENVETVESSYCGPR
ncbi:cystatin-like isoform X1 [Pyxicephalus adspersus]|uniref:cystatin-like isoform X1 n=1 Tax=Pyxicephalus adspersus TaxID=30357 RepID=UPI003B5BFCC3